MRHVYFPTDSIISLQYVMENGASTAILVVGNEGLMGITLFMGGESTPSRSLVQSAGYAYRLPRRRVKEEFSRHGQLLVLMLRYTQALITQVAQTAVCNRHHSIDQQLCRWLLLSMDRLSGSHLTMTQEFISNMLGVRREGVTQAASETAAAGRDFLQARADHGAGPAATRSRVLRVLRGGQEGNRPAAGVPAAAAGDPQQRLHSDGDLPTADTAKVAVPEQRIHRKLTRA